MSKKRIKEMGKRAREKKASEALERHRQSIEAPRFRQVVDIETHGSARFFVQHPNGTLQDMRPPRMSHEEYLRDLQGVPPSLDQMQDFQRSPNRFSYSISGRRRSDGSVEALGAHVHGIDGKLVAVDESEDFGRSLMEAVLPLAVAEIEAGGVGTAGLSSRSVDGFTDSYEECTRTFRGIYGPSAAVPSFADINEASHEDLVRALATGNDSQLSEEFISQRLSEPVPTAKVIPLGITPWKKEEESSEDTEPTAEEQIETLIKSPKTPCSVSRLFATDCAERALLKVWEDAGIEPDLYSVRALEVARQYARGEVGEHERRDAEERVDYYASPADRAASWAVGLGLYTYAIAATEYAASVFPDQALEREWQLAHLRDLIAEHNKHRLPLLLCLKERAQRIKQAPSYGQQLEEVLYT